MEIRFPIGGLSDALAQSRQEENTTPDAVNVRGVVPASGRLAGGTREGFTEQTDLGASAVREIMTARYDGAASTYSAANPPTSEWEKQTPQAAPCRNVAVDVQGNVYALDGNAGVALFNPAGELVWKFVLPVQQTDAICRALAVDDSGAFYVGVSEGGLQTDARLWKFRAREDGSGEPIREWEIELGCYVEDVRVRQGVLYAALNWPDRGQSHVVAYRLIDTAVPEAAWRQTQAPYPINGMDVRESDGAIFTAHPANATRGYDPRAPDCRVIAEDATPRDFIDDYEQYLWLDLDASDIDGDDSFNEDKLSGDDVTLWRDKSGNNRSAYDTETISTSAPANAGVPTVDRSKTFGGYDAVAFSTDATNYSNPWQELASYPNGTVQPNNKQAQRTFVPCYTDAAYSLLIVGRTTADTTPRVIWHQNDTDSSTFPRCLVTNANAIGGGGTATVNAGSILFGDQPNETTADFDSTTGFFIILVTVTNGGNNTIVVNGTAGATVVSGDETSLLSGTLGSGRTSITSTTAIIGGSTAPFDGQIARVMAFSKVLDSTEQEKLVGWAAWRFGLAHLLPGSHAYADGPPAKESLSGFGGNSPWNEDYLTGTDPMLVKWDPNAGRPRWMVSNASLGGTAAVRTGGIGYGVRVPQNASDRIYSVGPKDQTTGGTGPQQVRREAVVRCLRDAGSLPVLGAVAGTWEAVWGGVGSSRDYAYQYPKLGVSGEAANPSDTAGPAYLYVPYYVSDAGPYPAAYVYDYEGDGAALGGTDTAEYQTITLATGARGYACAAGPNIPEYEPGVRSSLPDARVAVGTAEDTDGDECVALVSLVDETRTGAAPASTYAAAASGTALTTITGDAATGEVTIPAVGLVQAAEWESRLWIAAGGTHIVLDGRSGIARLWRSKTAGELLRGAQLVSTWGDRIALAGSHETPFAVFLTAIGDPENCDLFPVTASGAEAVLLSAGDAVTALVPLRDDLLLVGTQGRLRRLTGNPAAGGILDDVSDVDGVSYGEAWCRDPYGNAYVFHSRGAVSRVRGDGRVDSLTDVRLRRRFEAVDQTTLRLRLVWNKRADGFHVIPVPVDPTTAALGSGWQAWFYEAKTGAWWEDRLGFIPTAARGMPDGSVWIGCTDGRVLRTDSAATTDDGEPIRWRVVGGPIRADDRTQVLVKRPRVTLAGSYDGATFGLYASGDAELPSEATAFAETTEGLGRAMPIRARGANVWWRLSGVGRFAFEGGDVLAEPFGIRRRLS